MAIVNRLFEFRTQRELTQEDVAQMTGVSRVTVGRVDRNRHYRPKGKTMQDLARGLGLRIGELFDDDELGDRPPVIVRPAVVGSSPTAAPSESSAPDATSGTRPDLVAAGVTRVPLGRGGPVASAAS